MFSRVQDWLRKRLDASPSYARGLAGVTQTPPSPLPRAMLWSLLALFALLMLWTTFGKLDIIATAEGKLVPRSFLKIVQPSEAGILRDLLVREGEMVKEGQVLMRMDTRPSDADTRTLRAELALRRLQMRRIDAELLDKPFIREANDPIELVVKVSEQYRAYRLSYADSLAHERAGLRKAQQDRAGAMQIRDKLVRSLEYYNKQTATFQKLGKEGFVSTLFVDDKERERSEKEHDLKAQEFTLASLEAAINQSERRIDQITSSYKQQLQTERMQATSQVEKLTQDLEKQEHKNALLELRAPKAGIVKDIASHTLGTVVTPGTILLTLVPQDEPLVAEVHVKNQDSGFIHASQTAKVKIASYPFQKYGMLEGKVGHFSADSSDTAGGRPEEINPESRVAISSHYKTHIELPTQVLKTQDGDLRLLPGMQVIAEINLGDRSILEYLLSPIQKAVREAGRER